MTNNELCKNRYISFNPSIKEYVEIKETFKAK